MILFACSRECTLASLLSNEPVTPAKGEFHESLIDLVFRPAPGSHSPHGLPPTRFCDPSDGQDWSHQLVGFKFKIRFRDAALAQLLAPESQSIVDAHSQPCEFGFWHSMPQGAAVSEEARTVTARGV